MHSNSDEVKSSMKHYIIKFPSSFKDPKSGNSLINIATLKEKKKKEFQYCTNFLVEQVNF